MKTGIFMGKPCREIIAFPKKAVRFRTPVASLPITIPASQSML